MQPTVEEMAVGEEVLAVDAEEYPVPQAAGNLQGTSMTAATYIDMLNAFPQQFEWRKAQQDQRHFYGEFYDVSSEQSYEERPQASVFGNHWGKGSMSSYEVQHDGAVEYEGSTVGMTATYLSTLSVRQISHPLSSLTIDGLILEIPFAEQDDPPHEEDTVAASLQFDDGIERMYES